MPTAARYSRPEVGRVLSAACSPTHPGRDLPLLCCTTSILSHILHHLRTQQWLHSPCRRARLQPRLPTVGAGAACGVRCAACGMGQGACGMYTMHIPCTHHAPAHTLCTHPAHTLCTPPCAHRAGAVGGSVRAALAPLRAHVRLPVLPAHLLLGALRLHVRLTHAPQQDQSGPARGDPPARPRGHPPA